MSLEPTGERVIEEHYRRSRGDYLIYLFHTLSYDFALPYVTGKEVLDYGCGSGYGTHRLAHHARRIVGVDISEEAIAYARDKYRHENLEFRCVSPAEREPLPFADCSFDTVVSYQVIEHVADVDRYLGEIWRVLREGGTALIATPDRSTRLFWFQKPWNMFHLVEYGEPELHRILSSRFQRVDVYGMGGEYEVLRDELDRTRKLKWLSLPFTLPFIPESLRVSAIRLLKRFQSRPPAGEEEVTFPFDSGALWISKNTAPSVNLITVSKKGSPG